MPITDFSSVLDALGFPADLGGGNPDQVKSYKALRKLLVGLADDGAETARKAVAAGAAAVAGRVIEAMVRHELSLPTATAKSVKEAAEKAAILVEEVTPGLTVAAAAAAGGAVTGPLGVLGGAIVGTFAGGAVGGVVGTAAYPGYGTLIGMDIVAAGGSALGSVTGGATAAIVGATSSAVLAQVLLVPNTRRGVHAVAQEVREAVAVSYTTQIARRPLLETNDHAIDLDARYPKVLAPSWMVLTKPDGAGERTEVFQVAEVSEASRAQFSVTAKTTRVTLNGHLEDFKKDVRATTVFAESQQFDLAEVPIDAVLPDVATDGIGEQQLALQEDPGDLPVGRRLIVAGRTVGGEDHAELVTVTGMGSTVDGKILITFTPGLTETYLRKTVEIAANVSPATHGETRNEVLGSGDSSRPLQRFTLREKPITYVSEGTGTGSRSTLQVFVGGVEWKEVPTLYGGGSRDRVYVTHATDDGRIIVQFGDGVSGSRLPTGLENVTARYRVGTGLEGRVKARQIKLLMTRPLGVQAVVNPIPASVAAAPESIVDARANAPITVMTLGRAVSLGDYENFARSFAGIAKAHATWVWIGGVRGILVTIAGADRAQVRPESDAYKALVAAFAAYGAPYVPVRIATPYQDTLFRFDADVIARADHQPDVMRAAIERALRSVYSFEARAFGQPVWISELIGVIQSVPGVVGVDLNALYRAMGASPWNPNGLTAHLPAAGGSADAKAAELLTLDPAPLERLRVVRQ